MELNSSKDSGRRKRLALQVGSVVVALLLFLVALRSVDAEELRSAMSDAAYGWVIPLVVVALASHLIRAWRWNGIIAGMTHRVPGRPPTLGESFGALMVGYMINYVVPRLGEVARAGAVSRRTGLPFAALVGTVAAERVLDMVTLLLALMSVAWILRTQLLQIADAVLGAIDSPTAFVLSALALLFAAILIFLLLLRLARRDRGSFVSRLARSFLDGFAAISKTPRRWLLAVQTILIWACYWTMAWIPLRMLRITAVYGVGSMDAWSIMNIGALGVVVPLPGGIGSYHLITIETLVVLFGVHPASAASYAVLTHGIQFVAYIIVGALSLALLGLSLRGALASGGGAAAASDGGERPAH